MKDVKIFCRGRSIHFDPACWKPVEIYSLVDRIDPKTGWRQSYVEIWVTGILEGSS